MIPEDPRIPENPRRFDTIFRSGRAAEAKRIVERLQAAGFVAYFAGGCVRDALLGKVPKDFDVATDATPDAVRQVFGQRNTLAFGAAFGVIAVLPEDRKGAGKTRRGNGSRPTAPDEVPSPAERSAVPDQASRGDAVEMTEVATFRSDGEYSDGRRPDSVHFGNAEQDALRRDFTINGMFYDPVAGRVIDFVGGRRDIEARLLRTIGDPIQRFEEDKLRMLRAIRFAAVLGFEKEPATFDAIRDHADHIRVVSGERIGAEMRRVMLADLAGEGLEQLVRTRLSRFVWPGLEAVDRGRIARRIMHLPRRSFPAALACALMEFARPEEALSRLVDLWKLSNEEQRAVTAALRGAEVIRTATVRPWSSVQPVLVDRDAEVVVDVAEADLLGTTPEPPPSEALAGIRRCRESLRWPSERLDPPPLLTGEDLIQMGFKPGPPFREMLGRARAAQLDGRVTTRDEAISLALAKE